MKTTDRFATLLRRSIPILLSGMAVTGVVATAITAAKAVPKAKTLVQKAEEEKGEPLTRMEQVQTATPAYIPAIATGVGTVMCILGAAALNQKNQAALASAYAFLNHSYHAYKTKVRDICGEETHHRIMDEIAVEQCRDVPIYAPGVIGSSTLDIDDDTETKRLFYDAYSQRYFESTLYRVLKAEYHLNRNFALGADVTVNDFYAFLGLEPIENGDVIGWYSLNHDGICWLDFDHHTTRLDDGLECCVIEMVFEPCLCEEW